MEIHFILRSDTVDLNYICGQLNQIFKQEHIRHTYLGIYSTNFQQVLVYNISTKNASSIRTLCVQKFENINNYIILIQQGITFKFVPAISEGTPLKSFPKRAKMYLKNRGFKVIRFELFKDETQNYLCVLDNSFATIQQLGLQAFCDQLKQNLILMTCINI